MHNADLHEIHETKGHTVLFHLVHLHRLCMDGHFAAHTSHDKGNILSVLMQRERAQVGYVHTKQ